MELSIGIDWGDRSHAACLRELNARRVLAEFETEHSAAGIARLEDTIAALDSEARYCQMLWIDQAAIPRTASSSGCSSVPV